MQHIVRQQYLLIETLLKKVIHLYWIEMFLNVVFQVM